MDQGFGPAALPIGRKLKKYASVILASTDRSAIKVAFGVKHHAVTGGIGAVVKSVAEIPEHRLGTGEGTKGG